MQASRTIDRLKNEVALTEAPIKILNQPQPPDAPKGSDQGNCIEMNKTVVGTLTTYSITVKYDSASKAFGLYYLKNKGCNTAPNLTNSEFISSNIFKLIEDKSFFTPSAALENDGYREINFNFQTSSGRGSLIGGQSSTVERLAASTVTPRVCRVVSPDKSWFTDFSNKKIRSVNVSITLNLDATNDRLGLTGNHSNIVTSNFIDIGVLNLFEPNGLTVQDWLRVLSDITYYQAPGAPTVTPSNPPKRITFTLGPGLSYTPSGVPSTHFYLAMKLDSTKNFDDASKLAASFCYPSFKDDKNSHYLGMGATDPGDITITPQIYPISCDTGNYPRLTGYLSTLSSEGENAFVQNKVLNTIYPQSNPETINLSNAIYPSTPPERGNFFAGSRSTTAGKFWLGGHFGDSITTTGKGNYYRWIKGFELFKEVNNQNRFADSSRRALQGDAAGYYYTSLFSNSSTTPNDKIYFDISGFGNSYWNAQPGSGLTDYLVVEFGDNRNAGGGNNTTDEMNLNAQIRLNKEITVVPFEFFKTCQ